MWWQFSVQTHGRIWSCSRPIYLCARVFYIGIVKCGFIIACWGLYFFIYSICQFSFRSEPYILVGVNTEDIGREKKLGLLSANSLTQQRLNRRFLAVFVAVHLCSPTTLLFLLWLHSNKRSWLVATYVSHLFAEKKNLIYFQNEIFLHYFECKNLY